MPKNRFEAKLKVWWTAMWLFLGTLPLNIAIVNNRLPDLLLIVIISVVLGWIFLNINK